MIFVAGGNSILNRRLCLVEPRPGSCMIESNGNRRIARKIFMFIVSIN